LGRNSREESLETRKKLLHSALDVMSEMPFSAVTMTEIARRVGLSKGAVYWHFLNKADLVVNMVEHFCNEMIEDLDIDLDPLRPIESLHNFFKQKISKTLTDERLNKIYRVMLYRYGWANEAHEKVRSYFKDCMEKERLLVEKVLSESRDMGVLREDFSPETASYAITSSVQGIFVMKLGGYISYDYESQLDFIIDAFGKSLIKNQTSNDADR
jgi:TetR/AcrR family acrAB operon transcriptional repressor